jgi:hypothetical protein
MQKLFRVSPYLETLKYTCLERCCTLVVVFKFLILNRACRKSLKPLQKKTLTGLNAPRVQAYELKSVKSLVQHHFRNVPKS